MNHTIQIHPGLVLKYELEERGITQTRLAEHIGVLFELEDLITLTEYDKGRYTQVLEALTTRPDGHNV